MDVVSLAIALKAAGKTAEQVKAALDEYLEENPEALDQAAVEAIVGEALAVMDGELDSVKSAIIDSNAGIETFGLYGEFVTGTQENGQYNQWYTFRVTCDSILSFDRDLTVKIDSGFRILFALFVDGAYSGDSSWITGEYIIPSGTQFKIVIAKQSEDTSSTANIAEFVNAVTIDTIEYTRTKVVNTIINVMDLRNPTLTLHANQYIYI